jgi:molybdopterin-guanine dinucleotide biosynthesis protein A
MGRDKAVLPVAPGRAMAAAVVDALAGVCGRVALVRRLSVTEPDLRDARGHLIPVVRGREGTDRHPLWGVAVALEEARTDWVIIAPCDVPALRADHVAALWEGRGPNGAVAWDGERTHPLLAVLPASAAVTARASAAAGDSVRSFVAALRRVRLPDAALVNVNTPDTLRSLSR